MIPLFNSFVFLCFAFGFQLVTDAAFNCRLPRGCRERDVDRLTNTFGVRNWYSYERGIRCDVRDKNNNYEFQLPNGTHPPVLSPNDRWCHIANESKMSTIFEIKWPARANSTLHSRFNLTNLFVYLGFFDKRVNFHFINLKTFEINLFKNRSHLERTSPNAMSLISSRLSFQDGNRLIRTCDDLINING